MVPNLILSFPPKKRSFFSWWLTQLHIKCSKEKQKKTLWRRIRAQRKFRASGGVEHFFYHHSIVLFEKKQCLCLPDHFPKAQKYPFYKCELNGSRHKIHLKQGASFCTSSSSPVQYNNSLRRKFSSWNISSYNKMKKTTFQVLNSCKNICSRQRAGMRLKYVTIHVFLFFFNSNLFYSIRQKASTLRSCCTTDVYRRILFPVRYCINSQSTKSASTMQILLLIYL